MRALQIAILIAGILITVPTLFAQDDALDKYPYVAKVTGNDVYVRSGPGTAYYYTQKLNGPDEVIVVGKKYDWLKIIPPKGSFSWISKRYVDPVAGNESVGIVTGENVRVYAGSPNVSPRNSSSLQTKLSETEVVRLTGDEMEDYYKIEPPATAYLWMSEQFLEYVGPVKEKRKPAPEPEPAPVQTKPEPKPEIVPAEKPAQAEKTEEQTVAAQTTEPAGQESTEPATQGTEQNEEPAEPQVPDAVRRVFDIEQAINNEVIKPLEKQDYSEYKTQLNKVMEADESAKAVRYAQFLLERIERFELAKLSQNQLDAQQRQLEKIREKIKKEREQLIAEIPDPGKYIVAGVLEESHIYTEQSGDKRYVIYSPEDRVLCYAVPSGDLENMNMEMYIGQNVGLNGTANVDEITPSSVVKFDQITVLE